jgi:hypothetical protein
VAREAVLVVETATPLQLNEVENSVHEHTKKISVSVQTVESNVFLEKRSQLGVLHQPVAVIRPEHKLAPKILPEVHPISQV